ncbi:hypothetical protein ACQUW5_06905 [Legionella sp. CNM-1927-20]|uniref:hypothetical protein n=1 Tax=Legionella sp. CNM-1927-20 TaxID=3422221 RepID=UPI00403AA27E
MLAHPGRTYREVVQKFLDSFDLGQKNVNDLMIGLRQAIVNHHIKHGESAFARGSLNQRLLFIDFVLNTERQPDIKPYEFIKPAINQDAESLLYEIVHRDIDPFYSDTIDEQRRIKFNEAITESGGILEYSKKLYQQNKLPIADFLEVLSACKEENIPLYNSLELEERVIKLINNKIWNKGGGVFWKSLPEGIGQMRELSHFGLNKLIEIAEEREKSIKFSFLENTGLRSNITSEFYVLLTSLKNSTPVQATLAITAFCEKWNLPNSPPEQKLESTIY